MQKRRTEEKGVRSSVRHAKIQAKLSSPSATSTTSPYIIFHGSVADPPRIPHLLILVAATSLKIPFTLFSAPWGLFDILFLQISMICSFFRRIVFCLLGACLREFVRSRNEFPTMTTILFQYRTTNSLFFFSFIFIYFFLLY